MKKYTYFAVAAVLAVSFIGGIARADTEGDAARQGSGDVLKARLRLNRTWDGGERENIKTENGDADKETKKQEKTARLSDGLKERTRQYWENMTNRLGKITATQRRLADLVAGRLDRSERNGGNVGELRAQLADARDAVSAADDFLTVSSPARLETILNESAPKEALAEVRALSKEAFEKIKEAHRALVGVVRDSKGVRGK